ncbi:MAG: hypothetical protein R2874_09690 [Desulfobacterales bacterium]
MKTSRIKITKGLLILTLTIIALLVTVTFELNRQMQASVLTPPL